MSGCRVEHRLREDGPDHSTTVKQHALRRNRSYLDYARGMAALVEMVALDK